MFKLSKVILSITLFAFSISSFAEVIPTQDSVEKAANDQAKNSNVDMKKEIKNAQPVTSTKSQSEKKK